MMETTPSPTFGALLRRYRLTAGLTQELLAERAGVSARAISDLERGTRRAPRADTLALLATALNLAAPARGALEAAARPLDHPSALTRPARPRGLLLPLVGRAHELALLTRHLAASPEVPAPEATAPLLLLTGEPGIGKSRLLEEAVRRAADYGLRVLQGGCQRRGGQASYSPVLEALTHHIHGQPPAQQRRDLQGCAWLVRLLPELASAPIEPLPAWTLTPEQERRLMFAAVGRFLRNVAGPRGTLLVLDDLQWAGADALELLATLVRFPAPLATSTDAGPGGELRVLGAYRDTEVAPAHPLSLLLSDLAHARLATQHRLGPLTPTEATQLLAGVLGERGDAAPVSERLLYRAGGHPFFLVSCAHGWSSGLWTAGVGDAVPWDVAQSIRQRVAALPAEARTVLGVAAVAGRTVPYALLSHAAALPEVALLAALDAVVQARLLVESGEEAYQFPHDVVREAVEADVGAARRRVLHRRLAEALLQLPGITVVEEVSYHYAHTAHHELAAYWLEHAGDTASAGFASTAALEHYTQARDHAVACGDAGRMALPRLDEKLGDLRLLTGDYARAREDFARAHAQLAEPARRAALAHKEGLTWVKQGEHGMALAALDLAEAEGTVDGAELPESVRAGLDLSRAEVHVEWGERDVAEAVLVRVYTILNAKNASGADALTLARAEQLQGQTALLRQDSAQAEACFRRSLALYERAGDQAGMAAAWHDLAVPLLRCGDMAQAEDCVQSSLAIRERIGDQAGMASCWRLLAGFALNTHVNLARAEEGARRFLAIAELIGDQKQTAWAWGRLGDVAWARGDLAQAETYFQRFLEHSERIGHSPGVGFAWNGLGSVALDRGDLVRATDCFERVRAGVGRERIESQHGVAEVTSNLGWVACEQGDLMAAMRWCRDARRRAQQAANGNLSAHAILIEAQTLLRAGRLRAAAVLLAHVRSQMSMPGFLRIDARLAVVSAELSLYEGPQDAARAAAEAALRRAMAGGLCLEEALARRLVGRCALAEGALGAAIAHLRAALALQVERGAALEAGRTRLVLAEALVHLAGDGCLPAEACTLVTEARAQFAASGATLDLAQVEQLAATWATRRSSPL
jgi:transcriptional regulator with XRE-family HTH domain/tetratricopeptide (TPR) repeat protein